MNTQDPSLTRNETANCPVEPSSRHALIRSLPAHATNQQWRTRELSTTPSSFAFYDDLRRRLNMTSSLQNDLNISSVDQERGSSVIRVMFDRNQSSLRLMHLAALLPLSNVGIPENNPRLVGAAKAGLMAAHDFNNRLDTVIPKLATRLGECNVKITIDFYDTMLSPLESARVLSQHVHKQPFPYEATAVAGPWRSNDSAFAAVLNALRGIPQISPTSTSGSLDNRQTYPLFGRVVSSHSGAAYAVLDYLANSLNGTHFAIIYTSDDYGISYRVALETAARKYNVTTTTVAIDALADGAGFSDAMQILKSTGYRHFFGAFSGLIVQRFLEEATKYEVIGPGFFWMLGDAVAFPYIEALRIPEDSPLVEAAQGIGLVACGADFDSVSFTGFTKSWFSYDNNPDFRHYFATKSPLATEDVVFIPDYPESFPVSSSALMYDAVMSLGLSACDSNETFFTGRQLFEKFLNIDFIGASGYLKIDPETGSRNYRTTSIKISNVIVGSPQVGMATFKAPDVLEYKVAETTSGQFDGVWKNIGGLQFMFSGGQLSPPASLPALDENLHLIGVPLVTVGISLGAFICLSAVYFAVWTWNHRNTRVIEASQPVFLIVVCIGAFLMASTVFPLSFDEPVFPASFLGCMAGYWLYGPGFGLVFSALFAKLWRINKIVSNTPLQRRVVVEARDVILPGVIIMSINLLILVCWQVVAPLVFVRVVDEETVDNFGRQTDSHGLCITKEGSPISSTVFLLALAMVNMSALVIANVQAYRARHVTTEYSESRYIGYAMAGLLQTMFIATPVFFLAGDQIQANYMVKASFTVVTSGMILFLIFLPKISFYRREGRRQRDAAARRQRQIDHRRAVFMHISDSQELAPGSDFERAASDGFDGFSQINALSPNIARRPGIGIVLVKVSTGSSSAAIYRRSIGDNTAGVRVISHGLSPDDEEDIHVPLPPFNRSNFVLPKSAEFSRISQVDAVEVDD